MAIGAATAAPAEAPKRNGGIDYSKFDNIEDSDDEKPTTATKDASKTPATEEKPYCHNCHKDIAKPLRCGVCKKVAYCSPQCQREDWQFHKRTCQPAAKAKAKPEPRRPPPSGEKRAEEKKKTEKVVEDDENITWYKHREWKPTSEPKREFKPEQITSEAAKVEDAGASATKTSAGSAWNAAGTWEEKDVTEFARKTLKEKLQADLEVDAAGGSLKCESVDDVEGDASKPVIRGKLRHMFDLGFKVNFSFRWMDSGGQKQAKGQVNVRDFTNDTFNPGAPSAPEVALSFKDARLLDAGRRQAVEAAIGAASWPPPAGSLMSSVASRMETWSKEYQQES